MQTDVTKKRRILIYSEPVKMTLSFHSLADLAKEQGDKLNGGDIFIFFNAKRNQSKVVWHDGSSYNSIDTRLESGTFVPDSEIKISKATLQHSLPSPFLGLEEFLACLKTTGNIVRISAPSGSVSSIAANFQKEESQIHAHRSIPRIHRG